MALSEFSLTIPKEEGSFDELVQNPANFAEFNVAAFDPTKEINNIINGNISKEGLNLQLQNFLKEYLTPLTNSQFIYYLNDDGKLYSPGWTCAMESSYAGAINEPGLSQREYQTRVAELESFLAIQAKLREFQEHNVFDRQIILQSPKENYHGDYSFISSYQLIKKTDGSLRPTVRVKMHRLINQDNSAHQKARLIWAKQNNITPTKLNQTPLEILGSALEIKRDTSFDDLLGAYYPNTSSLDSQRHHDQSINIQIDTFQKHIEDFVTYLLNKSLQSEYDPREVIDRFKIFLVYAKVHFDQQKAIYDWGDGMVKSIIDMMQKTGQDVHTTLQKSLLDLSIYFQGSCGKVGNTNLGTLTNALMHSQLQPLNLLSPSSERPDPSVCPNCHGTFYVDNDNSTTYQEICPICAKPIPRCT